MTSIVLLFAFSVSPAAETTAAVSQDDSPTVAEQEAVKVAVDSFSAVSERETSADGTYPKSPAMPFTASFVDLCLAENNRLRGIYAYDLQPYTLDSRLCQAAQWYAEYLNRTRQQGHFAYGMPWDRAARAGFTGTMLFNERLGKWYYDGGRWKREIEHDGGEVLAFGQPDIATAFDGWMHSKGHRAALLERSFNVAGFGHSGTVWCGMFGNSSTSAQMLASPTAAATPPPAQQPIPGCAGGQCFMPAAAGSQYVPQRRFFFRRW